MTRHRPPKPPESCYVCTEPADQARQLVTIEMAMRICRVSRSTVRRWIRDEWVESVTLASGVPRIYADSLMNDRPHRPGQP